MRTIKFPGALLQFMFGGTHFTFTTCFVNINLTLYLIKMCECSGDRDIKT